MKIPDPQNYDLKEVAVKPSRFTKIGIGLDVK